MADQHWNRLAISMWAILLTVISVQPLLKPTSSTVYPIYALAGGDFAAGEGLYGARHCGTDVFRYAPAVAAFFTPFSRMPLGVGGTVWRILGAAVFLTGLTAWIRRVAPDLSLPKFLLLALPLAIGSLSNGQANTHVIGLMLWGSLLASRERWVAAAFLIAAATLFKGYPIALGGLLVLLAPIRFGLPLLFWLAVGLGLPYVLQSADYVTTQYQALLQNLAADDRTALPLYAGYQDFHMLLRIVGIPVNRSDYRLVQAGTGLAAAGLLLVLRRRGVSRTDAAVHALILGTCWMCLFGPSVEASTLILMAPVVSLGVLAPRRRLWAKRAAFAGAGLFFASVVLFAFPHGVHRPVVSLGILPLASLLSTIGAVGRMFPERSAETPVAGLAAKPVRRAA
jgi:hypothetical protein